MCRWGKCFTMNHGIYWHRHRALQMSAWPLWWRGRKCSLWYLHRQSDSPWWAGDPALYFRLRHIAPRVICCDRKDRQHIAVFLLQPVGGILFASMVFHVAHNHILDLNIAVPSVFRWQFGVQRLSLYIHIRAFLSTIYREYLHIFMRSLTIPHYHGKISFQCGSSIYI